VKKKMKNDFDKKRRDEGVWTSPLNAGRPGRNTAPIRLLPLYSRGVCRCAVFYVAQCLRATSEVLY